MRKILVLSVVIIWSISFIGCIDMDDMFDSDIYEGTIAVNGSVTDDYTREGLPNVLVVVEGVSPNGFFGTRVEVGRFRTNNLGNFSATIKKLRDASAYEFFITADTNYYAVSKGLGAGELELTSKRLKFSLNYLTELVINLEKIVPADITDTVYVNWGVISEIYGPFYPCVVTNYGNYPDIGFRWIGGAIKSTIATKSFANRETEVVLDLYRNGKQTLVFDTIYCERGVRNVLDIKY